MFVAPSLKLSLSIYVHSTGCFFNCFSQFSVPKKEKNLLSQQGAILHRKILEKVFHLGTENREERLKTDTVWEAHCHHFHQPPPTPEKKRNKFVSWSKPPEMWSHLVYDQVGNLEWYWSVWTFENCGWCPWLQFDVNYDDDDDADDNGDNEDDS